MADIHIHFRCAHALPIIILCFLGRYEQVAARYHEMLESGIHPDGVTYSVLIAAAGKTLQLEQAWAHFRESSSLDDLT